MSEAPIISKHEGHTHHKASILELPPNLDKSTSSELLNLKFLSPCSDSQFHKLNGLTSYDVENDRGVSSLLALGVYSQVNTHSKAEYSFRKHCLNLKDLTKSIKPDPKIDPLFRFPKLEIFSTDEILDTFEIKTFHYGILTEKLRFTLEDKFKMVVESENEGIENPFSESQIISLIKGVSQFANFCHKNKFAIHNFSPSNIAVTDQNLVFVSLGDSVYFLSENEVVNTRSDLLLNRLPEGNRGRYTPTKADSYFIGLLAISLSLNKNFFSLENQDDVMTGLNSIKNNSPKLYEIINQCFEQDPINRKTTFELFQEADKASNEKFNLNLNFLPRKQTEELTEIQKLIQGFYFLGYTGNFAKISENAKLILAKITILSEEEMFSYSHHLLKVAYFLTHIGAFDTTANALYLVEKSLNFKRENSQPSIELETEFLVAKAFMKYEKKDFEDLDELLLTAFKSINGNIEKFRYNPGLISSVMAGLCVFYKAKSDKTKFDQYISAWESLYSNISIPSEPYRKINELSGDFSFQCGKFYESKDYFLRAKEILENAYGCNHYDYISICLKISQSLLEQDGDMEAFEYVDKALESALEEFGDSHRLTIPPLTTLGLIYFKKGQTIKSLNLYEKAADIFLKICGRENPGYPSIVNNIAILNSKNGNHKNAMKFINLAKISKENILKVYPVIETYELKISNTKIDITEGFDAEYLRIYNNLGILKSFMGDKLGAEISFVEAYYICEELKKIKKEDFFIKRAGAEIISNMAILNQELGRFEQAEKYLKNCDTEFENMGVDYSSSDRYKIRFNLAKLATERRNFREAKDLYSSLEYEIGNAGSLDTATLLNNIGAMHYLSGDNEKAQEYFKRSYDLKVVIYQTEEREEVAASLCNLALVDLDYESALEKYSRALEIMKGRFVYLTKKNKVIHQDIATIENNIGLILIKKRDFNRALEMLINSRDKKIQIYGTKHHEIGTSWNNMGICYFAKGDFAFAKESFRKALDVKLENLRDGHPSVRDTLYNLVLILEKEGKKNEAKLIIESQLTHAKQTYKKSSEFEEMGDFYFCIAELYDILKETSKSTKNYADAQELYSRVLGNSDPKTINVSKIVQTRREAY